jgi:hypothetical protein
MQRACGGKRTPGPCSYIPTEAQRAREKVGAVFHSMPLPNRFLKTRRYGHVVAIHAVTVTPRRPLPRRSRFPS